MRMGSNSLLRIWHGFLKLALVYAVYHLIRDIFQDVLGIHNAFTELAHFEADSAKLPPALQWVNFGGYGQYLTFPIEIFAILVIPRALKNKTFTKLDFVMVLVLLLTAEVYLINIVYSK